MRNTLTAAAALMLAGWAVGADWRLAASRAEAFAAEHALFKARTGAINAERKSAQQDLEAELRAAHRLREPQRSEAKRAAGKKFDLRGKMLHQRRVEEEARHSAVLRQIAEEWDARARAERPAPPKGPRPGPGTKPGPRNPLPPKPKPEPGRPSPHPPGPRPPAPPRPGPAGPLPPKPGPADPPRPAPPRPGPAGPLPPRPGPVNPPRPTPPSPGPTPPRPGPFIPGPDGRPLPPVPGEPGWPTPGPRPTPGPTPSPTPFPGIPLRPFVR